MKKRMHLNQKSAKMAAFLKSPERVSKIVEDIASHLKKRLHLMDLRP